MLLYGPQLHIRSVILGICANALGDAWASPRISPITSETRESQDRRHALATWIVEERPPTLIMGEHFVPANIISIYRQGANTRIPATIFSACATRWLIRCYRCSDRNSARTKSVSSRTELLMAKDRQTAKVNVRAGAVVVAKAAAAAPAGVETLNEKDHREVFNAVQGRRSTIDQPL